MLFIIFSIMCSGCFSWGGGIDKGTFIFGSKVGGESEVSSCGGYGSGFRGAVPRGPRSTRDPYFSKPSVATKGGAAVAGKPEASFYGGYGSGFRGAVPRGSRRTLDLHLPKPSFATKGGVAVIGKPEEPSYGGLGYRDVAAASAFRPIKEICFHEPSVKTDATAKDVEASIKPEVSSLGILFHEICDDNMGMWEVILSELREFSSYFISSVKYKDEDDFDLQKAVEQLKYDIKKLNSHSPVLFSGSVFLELERKELRSAKSNLISQLYLEIDLLTSIIHKVDKIIALKGVNYRVLKSLNLILSKGVSHIQYMCKRLKNLSYQRNKSTPWKPFSLILGERISNIIAKEREISLNSIAERSKYVVRSIEEVEHILEELNQNDSLSSSDKAVFHSSRLIAERRLKLIFSLQEEYNELSDLEKPELTLEKKVELLESKIINIDKFLEKYRNIITKKHAPRLLEKARALIFSNIRLLRELFYFEKACGIGQALNDDKSLWRQKNYRETTLYAECSRGNYFKVKEIIDRNIRNRKVNEANIYGETPLFIASFKGFSLVVEELLNIPQLELNISNKHGATPLFMACQEGHTYIVSRLIRAGAQLEKAYCEDVSPFYIACQNGHYEVAELLLSTKRINIDRITKRGFTPLHAASIRGHSHIVKLLLDFGADYSIMNNDGRTAFLSACEKGLFLVVKRFIEKNKEIVNQVSKGLTPLYLCCSNNSTIEVIKLLLESGADPNEKNDFKETPLMLASANGNLEIVNLLLGQDKIEVNRSGKAGAFPLFLASQFNNEQIIKCLLSKGAEIDKASNNGATSLMVACEKGNEEAVRVLIEKDADVNKPRNDGKCPLVAACHFGFHGIVESLIKKGADANVKSVVPPICASAYNKDTKMMMILINNGASVNSFTSRNEATPLFIACEQGDEESVDLLLECQGIDLEKPIKTGATPLFIACQNGYFSIVSKLIEKGAQINSAANGATPVYMACQNGHADVLELLLKKGADIDNYPSTDPVAVAVYKGHIKILNILMEYRGDVVSRDHLKITCNNSMKLYLNDCLYKKDKNKRKYSSSEDSQDSFDMHKYKRPKK